MSNTPVKPRTKKVGLSELPQYFATLENAPGYPPSLGDIQDTIAEEFIVEEASKPKETEYLTLKDWWFKHSVYFRGPAVCIKHVVRQYLSAIYEVTDFGNGIAQVFMDSEFAYEIMQQNPVLRVTGFAFVGRENCVVLSETGHKGLTDIYYVDCAKDEGDHWMHEADVLKDAKYKVYDIRTGAQWTENYHFPFRQEWESNVFIMEEKRKYYSLSAKDNGAGEVTLFSKSVTPPIVSLPNTPVCTDSSLQIQWDLNIQRGLERCEENPSLVVAGKKFVFTGLPWCSGMKDKKDAPVVQWIISHGGLYRQDVSSVTDYLIIGDNDPGATKIEKALNLQDTGKPIQLIRFEVLEKLIQNGDIVHTPEF